MVQINHTNELFTKAFESALKENKDNEEKYREIFLKMSYLNSHKEAFKSKVLNDIIENGIGVLSNYDIDYIEDFQSLVLFPYSGNKIKFKEEMVEMYNLAHNDNIDTICDTFLGAGGSISSLYHTFLEKGVKNLIVNDFNHTLINVHQSVAERTEELINSVINMYRTIELFNDNLFNPSEDTLDKFKKAFLVLEKSQNYENIQTSALFLFFQNITFSGAYKGVFEDGKDFKNTKTSAKIYDINRYFQGLLNTIIKIKEYSKIYNSFNTIFMNEDYKQLVDKLKNDDNVLFLFDPPYYDSSANYGLKEDDFNQRELLKKLSGLAFLYNNNKHREIFEFIQKYNYHSMSKLRRNNSSGKSDTPVYEYLISSNLENIETVKLTIS